MNVVLEYRDKSFEELKSIVHHNHNDEVALYCLGLCLVYGRGVNKNVDEGLVFLKASADLGYEKARYMLDNIKVFAGADYVSDVTEEKKVLVSDMIKYKEGTKEHYQVVRKLAESHNLLAIYHMGKYYKNGLYKSSKVDRDVKIAIVEKDEEKAFEYLSKVASNNIYAYLELADCYLRGIGCHKDLKKAYVIFKELSLKEDLFNDEYMMRIYNALGICVLEGIYDEITAMDYFSYIYEYTVNNDIRAESFYYMGVCFEKKNNRSHAIDCYDQAYKLGYVSIKEHIRDYAYQYALESSNIKYYTIASEYGHKDADMYLFNYYISKKHYHRERALHYADRVRFHGNGDADYYYNASFLYRNSYNFAVPWNIVVEFMEKARELGHDDCDIPLAAFYYERDGRNAKQGYEIIKKLADEGHEFALTVLAGIYYMGYGVDKNVDLSRELLSHVKNVEVYYRTKYGYVVKDFDALIIMMRDGL